MKYAFNLSDLHTYFHNPEYRIMVEYMIYPVLNFDDVIIVDKKRVDENAIVIKDDIPQERMKAILDLIRNGLGQRKGVGKNLLRIYQSKKGGWVRI